MTSVSDEDLVLAVQAGDTDSLGVLVARWEQPLFRFVYRMLPRRDDAHDVCQETFLRILRRADRFRPGSRFDLDVPDRAQPVPRSGAQAQALGADHG